MCACARPFMCVYGIGNTGQCVCVTVCGVEVSVIQVCERHAGIDSHQ